MSRGRGWTDSEINLLTRGLPIKKIAEKTNRTENAVKCKMYEMNICADEYIREPMLAKILSQTEKENRLYRLMDKMCIRLATK